MKDTKYLLVLAYLLLGACSFQKESEKQKKTIETTTEVLTQFERNREIKKQSEEDNGQLTDQNVSLSFIENKEPGSYRLRINWPESVVSMSIQINDGFEMATAKDSYYETNVIHDTEYRIRLYSKNSNGVEVSRKEIAAKSPKDFILQGHEELNQDTSLNVRRLYIFSTGRLLTNGFNLSIRTEKLFIFKKDDDQIESGIFEADAHITTSPRNKIAHIPVQLSGSKISITAKEAHGHLRVALLGVNGQNGRNGDELDQAKGFVRGIDPNLNGANGEDGIVLKDQLPCPSRRMDIPCEKVKLICQKAPTNGAPGKTGLAGTTGEDGMRGGDSGSLFVHVEDSSNLTIEVGQRAGMPGHGGNGGTGSLGGLGGKPGKNPGYPCTAAQDGPEGPRGPKGNEGKTGADGKIGTVDTGAARTTVFAL